MGGWLIKTPALKAAAFKAAQANEGSANKGTGDDRQAGERLGQLCDLQFHFLLACPQAALTDPTPTIAKMRPTRIPGLHSETYISLVKSGGFCVSFCCTYNKIGTIQRRLAWPLRKDDTQIREAFHIFYTPLRFLVTLSERSAEKRGGNQNRNVLFQSQM